MASSSEENKFKLPDRYGNIGNSVWNEFTQLAIEYKPVHLAQGFPDFPAPQHVTKILEEVAINGDTLLHQYARGFKQKTDPSAPTTSADWALDPSELASKFNSNTKAIILNSPLNPIGKVFTFEELTIIADLCKKWNTLCISDEVYEWITYKPSKHVRMATLPGMWERTITIGTAGKTFGVTGWKVGWAYGPANLMENLRIVHQNVVSSCTTPLQEAVARCLELEMTRMDSPECIFNQNAASYKPKRDFLVKALTQIGMKPIIPEGGYFIVADWSALENSINLSKETDEYKDYRFAKYLTKNAGLLGIPASAFFSGPNKPLASTFIRFCFVKKEETLQKAAEILQNWKPQR